MEQTPTHSTYSKDGNVHSVQTGVPDAPATPAPGPQIKAGPKVTYRATVNSETGETQVSSSRPAAAKVNTDRRNADPLDNSETPRARLTEDSIIKGDAIGGSMRMREALNLGWVRKTADGYVFLGTDGKFQQNPAAQPNKPQEPPKPQDKPAVVNPNDGKDLPGLSEESDNFLSVVQRDAPAAHTSTIIALAEGQDLDSIVENLATSIPGRETSRAEATAVIAQYRAVAVKAIGNVGVPEALADAFVFNMRKTNPDGYKDALLALADRRVGPLQDLARTYVQTRERSIVNMVQAKGVDVTHDNGNAFLNISQLERAAGITIPRRRGAGDFASSSGQTISLREAIRLGYVTVSE